MGGIGAGFDERDVCQFIRCFVEFADNVAELGPWVGCVSCLECCEGAYAKGCSFSADFLSDCFDDFEEEAGAVLD